MVSPLAPSRAALVATLVALVGLVRAAVAAEPTPDPGAITAWIRPFRVANYSRRTQFDDLPADIGRYRLTHLLDATEPLRTLYVDCERRLDRHQKPDCVLTFLGREGYGNAASLIKGAWDWWSPPEVVLPATVAVGAEWRVDHQKSTGASERACRIVPDTAYCDDGIASECRTYFGSAGKTGVQGTVLLREHFCRDLGWVGEDATAQPDGQHRFATLTYDLVVDGVAMPTRRDVKYNDPLVVPGSGSGT